MIPAIGFVAVFYVLTIASAVVIACATRWSSHSLSARLGKLIVGSLVSLLVLEVCSLIALRVNLGYWLYGASLNPNAWVFEDHPNMVATMMGKQRYIVPKKGSSITITHNSLGFRGGEFGPKSGSLRVIAVGGSTTYGVDVSNDTTWTAKLEHYLGKGYEVLNLGVAGHATAEHLYLMGAVVSRLQPDVVLLHIGLNDMHCMHSPEITPLFNKCHSKLLALSTGRCFAEKLPQLAIVQTIIATLQNLGWVPRCPSLPKATAEFSVVDDRVVNDFKARAGALVSMALALKAKVVLVPQVGFNQKALAQGAYRWWTPYLDQRSLPEFMKRFNQELRGIATQMGVSYVDAIDETSWPDDIFVDASHLNATGNEQLATLIAPKILETQK